MHSLRVLDLSCTSIRCLPQSLSNLIELRVLLLRDCECLKDLPSLVKLRELRVLDLSHTAIRYLPEGMEGLINLRRLHLCGTTELEMFPFGIISSVTCLEELLMVGSKWKWSSNGNERRACVEEIARLTHLRKLLVNFMDLTALYSYVKFGNWRDLKCFLLVVGQKEEYMDDCVQDNFYSRVRKVEINSITECMNSLVLPESTLTLDISACDKIYIVTKGEKPFLPSLNELWIRELHNLRTICKEPTHGNLANLKRICIECCTSTELSTSLASDTKALAFNKTSANQPLLIIIATISDSPLHLPALTAEVAPHAIIFADKNVTMDPTTELNLHRWGTEIVVLDQMNLGPILDFCGGQGLYSILIVLKEDSSAYHEILEMGLKEGLLEKVVKEICPLWAGSKEGVLA
ncbi:hypothetical protein AAC387_Pa04g1702 [Persea americana]